jgi:hypothetical protein
MVDIPLVSGSDHCRVGGIDRANGVGLYWRSCNGISHGNALSEGKCGDSKAAALYPLFYHSIS